MSGLLRRLYETTGLTMYIYMDERDRSLPAAAG